MHITFLMLKVSGFDYNMSILILVYVVLGGIGNLRGSIIATSYSVCTSGTAQRICKLSYVDLCDRTDHYDAL